MQERLELRKPWSLQRCTYSLSSGEFPANAEFSTPNMTRRRLIRTMEMIPALPWQSKSPSVSAPIERSTKQGNARGTSEVRRGTSSIHFHCPVPRSSGHIGHGNLGTFCHFRGRLRQDPCNFPSCKHLQNYSQEWPLQTKPKKGPKRKVHEFRPFL